MTQGRNEGYDCQRGITCTIVAAIQYGGNAVLTNAGG